MLDQPKQFNFVRLFAKYVYWLVCIRSIYKLPCVVLLRWYCVKYGLVEPTFKHLIFIILLSIAKLVLIVA